NDRNSKIQTMFRPGKFWSRAAQAPALRVTKTFQDETLFGFSNFGHWDLFDIWYLIFGISISQ
ncbi:MAG: hypothetical protein R6U27_01155, partial [Desulfobacterales bacterium]